MRSDTGKSRFSTVPINKLNLLSNTGCALGQTRLGRVKRNIHSCFVDPIAGRKHVTCLEMILSHDAHSTPTWFGTWHDPNPDPKAKSEGLVRHWAASYGNPRGSKEALSRAHDGILRGSMFMRLALLGQSLRSS